MAETVTDRGPVKDEPKKGEKTARNIDEFLRTVVKRFNRVESAESANRQKAVEDLKFKGGDQWPEAIKAQRTLEKRPCLTINKMKTFVHQITNDQRQNRPSINVSPVGDKGDVEVSKMLKGLIKQIERSSKADVAYDTAFDNAVSNGWGYFRIFTECEDEDTFDQVIRVGRIRNPFRVYLDPDHEDPTGSDAQWGFISDLIPREEFKDKYPDADDCAWTEGGLGDEYKSWSTSSHVRIAEYFVIENEVRTLLAFDNGYVGFEDEMDESYKSMEPTKKREVQVKKVKWYTLTAREILEEEDWPGKWIPIVKVIGDEVDVDGKVTLAGLIRDAKDAQRMYNFWVTSETELIALAPKAPWIMEEGQIEGHEQRWKDANNKSLPYLLYKGTNIAGKPSPPPQRQQFAGPPAGVVQAKIAAAQDMQATTGIRFDATLQERNYDESGKALRELKRVGDLGNFHYVDNLGRSLMHAGEIFIDLIPKIYDTARVVTILREDGSEEQVKIDPSMAQPHAQQQAADGRIQRLYNPKLGDYAVTVTIGPNFATKRIESAEHMMEFLKILAPIGQAGVVADLIAKNQDWPGSEEITTRLQAMLPPGMLDKGLDRLPPEARGPILQLKQQLQQTTQKLQQATAMLGDQDKDRQLDKYGVDKDFEAKVLKIIGDLEKAKITKGADADPNVPYAKINADLEAKVLKIIADHELGKMKLSSTHNLGEAGLASKHALGAAGLESQHMLGEAKNASAADLARSKAEASDDGQKGPRKPKPDIVQPFQLVVNTGSGSKVTDFDFKRDRDGKLTGMHAETKVIEANK